MTEEQDLERKAVEELLREAARARVRAETMGPAGWAKCPLHSTNKRFLLNTLRKTTLRQCSVRTGSSQSETRRRRDGRQATEPRFRRPQRVRPNDDTPSQAPAETQPTSKSLSPKNTHTQTHHNDRHTQTNQKDTHTPTHTD
ncbi:protein POLR1D-like [Anguilla rostrata]|uniref:protein POLR1D-like n=1 Tax=Anguilla rostrata TaxID=7938 RepID=UPI0030D3BE79